MSKPLITLAGIWKWGAALSLSASFPQGKNEQGTFYRWQRDDFVEVPSDVVLLEDEMAYGYGGDLKYGTVEIEDVTIIRDVGIFLQYLLPPGALAQSNERLAIAILWEGNTLPIQIDQQLTFHKRILIQRRE